MIGATHEIMLLRVEIEIEINRLYFVLSASWFVFFMVKTSLTAKSAKIYAKSAKSLNFSTFDSHKIIHENVKALNRVN